MAGLIIVLVVGAIGFNPRLTAIIEGEAFRKELEKQTAKGLHFETGTYAPIKRTAAWTGESESFEGTGGIKAFRSLEAEEIKATFNPAGIFLRRWQLDSVHIARGDVKIQTYEPKPDNKPPKPWYAIFMPDRVYLKRVVCDHTDITWKFRGRESGFKDTVLVITPYGRDFNYEAAGGNFDMKPLPTMPMEKTRLTITKELLTVHELNLKPGNGSIRLTGTAGLKEDKSMDAKLVLDDVPISPWIPAKWGDQVKGVVSGEFTWKGKDQKLESSSGEGNLRMRHVVLASIPFLDYVASAARNEELKAMELEECSMEFSWKYPRMEVRDIEIEADEAFRIVGNVTITTRQIDGTLNLGVKPENLDWLPKAKELIFTRSEGGYLWTKVKLSGTLQEPQNDLTPRIAEVLRKSPTSAAGLFFREVGEWIEQKIGGGDE